MKLLCAVLVLLCCYFCVTVIALDPSTVCTTPNGETAACVLLFKCPILIQSASDDPIKIQFIQASACGTENFMVCCGTSAGYIINKQNKTQVANKINEKQDLLREERRRFALEKLIPSRIYCGLQHTDDYLYTKEETSVDEFPWMVYIPTKTYTYGQFLRIENSCVGILINNRYVLTHKGCNYQQVVLGQHHIYKDVSCIGTPYDVDDCTNPVITEFVESWDNYWEYTNISSNIALLRLQRKISYSDYIRPICLPLPEVKMPNEGEVVITSGWGEEQNTQGKTVKLKKRIKHTLLNKEECENGNPVPNPICGERFANSTSYVCPGDKGGALMYRYKNSKNLNWIALGIITGSTSCAKDSPAVAERITPELINWILDKIKA